MVVEIGGRVGSLCCQTGISEAVLGNASIVQASIAASNVTAVDLPPFVTDPTSI